VKEDDQTVPEVRTTEKALATRATLIDAAVESFVTTGYGATSVRDLAQRSDMTTGAIYAHFRGKANLLGEAVKLRIDHDLEQYGRRRYGDVPLADYLARNFRDYRRRAALRALLVESAAAARVDDHARELVRDVIVAKQDEWAAIYRELWEKEDLDPEVDPAALMMLLWAAELGLGMLEAFDIEPPKPSVLARNVGRLVGSLSEHRQAPRRNGRRAGPTR
jgi:AcrR family transcriptional regulator